MNNQRIHVLVVDDSAFMRKVISEMLESDERIRVVGTARNGEEALKKRAELQPDVITLDVEMPVMGGIETLKRLMSEAPCPVIMLSSTTKEGAEHTLLAMELGAFDFIAKTSGPISLDLQKVQSSLIDKVIHAAKAKIQPLGAPQPNVEKSMIHVNQRLQGEKTLVAIGTSTGGPKALKEVLTRFPKDINAPILVVQHMPPGFTQSLAVRLDSLSSIKVKEASDGELLENGVAYIAPGGYHLTVKNVGNELSIKLNQLEPRRGHRPSVDVMLESLAELSGFKKIVAILTGMGSDGTEGLIKMKKQGSCYAIAESEESSIVFGMPKAAIQSNQVDEVAHLQTIASSIMRQC
ncbi:protein-glutamate methylesterase/protein-glutamine glutaminase [Halalkalibacterium ligniniphilum]|uniref:protein-glutamate methylesterase/protein-glutamine glutaminase n=1 Tax=Halalkalibacterium ligniniphilum TaxID=1134413 RepID=UPI000349900A|nr:chemotaxis response regulator protein-glutamate methylesterase [Halalkalibacterium ligniniphilum]